jgi:hypothetical protein
MDSVHSTLTLARLENYAKAEELLSKTTKILVRLFCQIVLQSIVYIVSYLYYSNFLSPLIQSKLHYSV